MESKFNESKLLKVECKENYPGLALAEAMTPGTWVMLEPKAEEHQGYSGAHRVVRLIETPTEHCAGTVMLRAGHEIRDRIANNVWHYKDSSFNWHFTPGGQLDIRLLTDTEAAAMDALESGKSILHTASGWTYVVDAEMLDNALAKASLEAQESLCDICGMLPEVCADADVCAGQAVDTIPTAPELRLNPRRDVLVNDKLYEFNAKTTAELEAMKDLLAEAKRQEVITAEMVLIREDLISTVAAVETNRRKLDEPLTETSQKAEPSPDWTNVEVFLLLTVAALSGALGGISGFFLL